MPPTAVEVHDLVSEDEVLPSKSELLGNDQNSADDFMDLPKKPGATATLQDYTLDGVKVKFPFHAYPSQLDMMTSIIKTLNKSGKSHALLESPTGSGKSMAILCGALAWLEVEKTRVAALIKEKKAKAKISKDSQAFKPKGDGYLPPMDDDDIEPSGKKTKVDCGSCGTGCEAESMDSNQLEGDGEEEDELVVPKIFFASRTHKQLGQLVKELRRSGYRPKFTVLGSRNQYCVNERVRNSKDINESCKEQRKECKNFNGTGKAIDKAFPGKAGTNMDVEDLVKFGKTNSACPYFLSRELATNSDIIFAPYNYIMDPGIRGAMGINLEKAIVIIDEAHNIEDTCRSAGSFEITADSLYSLQTELNVLLSGVGEKAVKCPEAHRSLLHVATIFHTWISTNAAQPSSIKMFEEKVDIWKGWNIPDTLKTLGVVPETLDSWQKNLEDIVQRAQAMTNATKRRGGDEQEEDDVLLTTGSQRVFASLFNVLELMLTKGKENLESYRMVRIQKIKSEKTSRKLEITLGFWCLSPDVIFRPLANKVKSIILTSGTLSPMNTFASELFTKFEEKLEALHIIKKEQVWIGCLPSGPQGVSFLGNFKNMETLAFQDELGRCIFDVCKKVPFGVLCFLPSYAFMEKLINRLKSIGLYDQIAEVKRIFMEPRSGPVKEFEGLMKRYYSCISACKEGIAFNGKSASITGALFFAVYRGKVSEGLDLADDNCRAVIPIGIPYPAYKDQKVVQKREFNDQRNSATRGAVLNGMQWYETQAFRALNQALGRCIRHRLDWGAIILLEQRFTNPSNVAHLSKWVRSDVKTYNRFQDGLESLERFVSVNKAKEVLMSEELSEIKAHMHEDDTMDAVLEDDQDNY